MSGPLARVLEAGIQAAVKREGWPVEAIAPVDWQAGTPRRGDIATPVAFAIAKRLGQPADAVARAIADAVTENGVDIEAASGYLNLTLSPSWSAARLEHAVPKPPDGLPHSLRLTLPDAPLSLGQAQLAVLASSLARLLTASEGPTRLRVAGAAAGRPLLESLGVLAEAWEPTPREATLALNGTPLDWVAASAAVPDWSARLAELGRDALRAALLVAPGQPVRPMPPRETLDEPLYFLQYTHSRACSLERLALPIGESPPAAARPLLIALALYADRIAAAGTARAPWRMWAILGEIAEAFHVLVRQSPPGDAPWPGYGNIVSTTRKVMAHGLEALMFLSVAADI